MAKFYQIQPSWNCNLFDPRGDKLPGSLVVNAEKIEGFETAKDDALYDVFAGWLEKKYGFKVRGMSFMPVASRRGIPGII